MAIVPLAVLRERDELIQATMREHSKLTFHSPNPDANKALAYYELFSEDVALRKVALGPLSELDIFYNRYFWFLSFAKLHREQVGADAGIEQQAYKILEAAPPGIDWKFVESIIEQAG